MNTKFKILFTILLAAIILVATGYFLFWQTNHDVSLVSISTDRQEYSAKDPVHITIRNLRDRSIDIYCPYRCSLGNVPTTMERWSNGEWQQFSVLCPFEPSLGMGDNKAGDYIQHMLPAKSTLEVTIDTLEYLDIQGNERWRVVYYLGPYKVPVHSNEFIVTP